MKRVDCSLVLLLLLQVRLNGLVLGIEVAHVDHQVLDDKHVGEGGDLGDLGGVPVHLGQAGKPIGAVYVHGT